MRWLRSQQQTLTRSLITAIVVMGIVFALFAGDVLAHPPWGIVVDHQGQVYFSDLVTVWKIDAQGKVSVFRAGRDTHTHDLNIDEAGNLYGAENSYDPATQRFFSAIWKMTPAGGFSYLLAPTENPPQGTSIWKDPDGNMYHVTHYPERDLLVLKRNPNGDVNALVGSSNAARKYRQGVPYSAAGIVFGSDGTLYFVHGANVSKITKSGTLIPLARNLVVGNTSGESAGGTPLFGITVDALGNAFVADHGNRRVLKITSDGKLTTVLSAEVPWSPSGVAFRNGSLYILEYGFTPPRTVNGTRVRKLSADGAITLLANVGENENPAVRENPTSENVGPTTRTQQNAAYALIGAAVGIFALTIVIWRVRRKLPTHERKEG